MSSSSRNRLDCLLPGVLFLGLIAAFGFRDQWLVILTADYVDNIELTVWFHRALLLSLWIVGTWFFLSFIRIFFWEGVVERRRGEKVPDLLTNLFRLVVFTIVGICIAVSVFHLSELSVTLLVGGVATFVAVFFRDFLAQLFAGLSINLDRGIDIGANLSMPDGTNGTVEEMNWRSVTLRLADGSVSLVPNTLMAQSIVNNRDHLGDRVLSGFEVTLDFSLAVERAERILNAALSGASQDEGIAALPAPQAFANGPGTSGVCYRIEFYYHSERMTDGQARSMVTRKVMRHLKAAGVYPALPKQNVFVGEARMTAMSWDDSVDRQQLISNIGLFGSMSKAELAQLAGSLEVLQVNAGDVIITEGETSTSMYGLAEGVLEVSVENQNQSLVVAVMEPGSFFGEMSMLAGEPRSATVKALVDSLIFELHREDFSEVIVKRADIAESISRLVVERQLANDEAMRNASAAERDEAISDASLNLLDRIKAVFSLFRPED